MKPIDRVFIVVSALITFLLASTGVTVIYLTVGGTFDLTMGLALYVIVELYLALCVINVALRRPGQIRARRENG